MSEASRSSTVVLCVNGTRHRLRLDHRDRPRCAARAPGPDRDQERVRPLAVRRVHRAARHLAPYHLPAHADVPAIEIGWIDEHDTQVNPLGVKGIGELGVVGTAAAIANAVWHATGVRYRSLPLTPDRVLQGTAKQAQER
jgi:hypothetical protein